MNDKKFHAFRRTPDEAYADTLYQRLAMLPQSHTAAPQPEQHGRSRKTRLAWVVALLLAGILVMAIVPGVRARFEDIVKEIGGLSLFITEDYPFSDNPNIVPDDIITLEEAADRLGFEFNLPAYIPEGMVLKEDEIHASNITTYIRLMWQDENARGRFIELSIGPANDIKWVVAPEGVTEVMVNDTPAILIQGGWSADTEQWEDFGNKDLRWQLAGAKYMLYTVSEEFGGLPTEELIKIAESIAPMETPVEAPMETPVGAEKGGRVRPEG